MNDVDFTDPVIFAKAFPSRQTCFLRNAKIQMAVLGYNEQHIEPSLFTVSTSH